MDARVYHLLRVDSIFLIVPGIKITLRKYIIIVDNFIVFEPIKVLVIGHKGWQV
jgi:hypothetical protein